MGVIASCCRDSDADENEALLASQNGHGDHNDDYNAVQRQMKEQEEQLRARENMLKKIVANTNDKLIDISMISNSGIVIQGTDLKNPESSYEPEASHGSITDNANAEHDEDGHKIHTRPRFVTLETDTAISDEMKSKLKQLHETIFTTLDEQLRVEPTGKLTVTLK